MQIGIRGAQNTEEGWNFSLESGMRVIFMEEFTRLGVEAVVTEAQALLRGLRGLHLVGGDVVEVAPPFDLSGNTALVAATTMYEILKYLKSRECIF